MNTDLYELKRTVTEKIKEDVKKSGLTSFCITALEELIEEKARIQIDSNKIIFVMECEFFTEMVLEEYIKGWDQSSYDGITFKAEKKIF